MAANKKKLFRPAVVGVTVPILLVCLFFVAFLGTCVEYSKIRGFRGELDREPDAHKNLNRYRRLLARKQQKLATLRRSVSIRFRSSEFKKRVEAMARLSGIPVNDVSIERFRLRGGSDFQKLLIEVRVKAVFPALGAFLSRLETATVKERDRFAYVLRVQKVDIAVIKLYERVLSARIHLTVFRKVGG